jgi:hypothetical protein
VRVCFEMGVVVVVVCGWRREDMTTHPINHPINHPPNTTNQPTTQIFQQTSQSINTHLVLEHLLELPLRHAVAVEDDAVREGLGGLVELEQELLAHGLSDGRCVRWCGLQIGW